MRSWQHAIFASMKMLDKRIETFTYQNVTGEIALCTAQKPETARITTSEEKYWLNK
jgi:hypothetical protein